MSRATTHDGREVSTDSEDWRHETEARHVASLPSAEERRAYIAAVESRRGKDHADRLRATLRAIWGKRKP